MTCQTISPFGSWRSPLSAEALTAGTVALQAPAVDGSDLYWLEGRPTEGGRVVLVRRSADGSTSDMTGAPYNVRSRVHEYGGGAYDVSGGVVVFCNFDDRRVYRLDASDGDGAAATPVPITPEGTLRYGDLRLDVERRAVYAVCEDHGTESGEPENRLVRLDLDGDNGDGGQVVVRGHDFFSSPTLCPDGRRLAWVQWDHPDMPWDSTQLCVADVSPDGSVSGEAVVAGGPGESVSQPCWASSDRLVFVSDRTGWWNLYELDPHSTAGPRALWAAQHEFADPAWMLGGSSYGITSAGQLLCTWLDDGYARLGVVDLESGERRELETDVTAVYAVCVRGDTALLLVGYPDRPNALLRLDLAEPGPPEVVRTASDVALDPAYVSPPEAVTWRNGEEQDVFGFLYSPRSAQADGPEGELPPLIVMSHGGPTGMTKPVFDLGIQYWTTRGLAVLQVNYGGSAGYGREYRERLRGRWGIVDVDDCATGALAMASEGRADGRRLAIRGGSAGGFTTLAALTFTDTFRAGASYFGVGDLEALARDTHKFESRYLDGLVGPHPERRDLYLERSPVHHVDRLSCPVILLQGTDDLVVPRAQAESMAEAVRAKGPPVALLMFEGEGHGFRRADTIVTATEAEAYFYSRVFGFDLADPVPEIAIDNLG